MGYMQFELIWDVIFLYLCFFFLFFTNAPVALRGICVYTCVHFVPCRDEEVK